jgi:hypothetical protein
MTSAQTLGCEHVYASKTCACIKCGLRLEPQRPPSWTPEELATAEKAEGEFWRTMDPSPKRRNAPRAFGERLWAAKTATVTAKRKGPARWWGLFAVAVLHLRWWSESLLFRARKGATRSWWSSTLGQWALVQLTACLCWGIRNQTPDLSYDTAKRLGRRVTISLWAENVEATE